MAQSLRKTALYGAHQALKAKMVPFAGYHMPVQYVSLMEEHRACRNQAAIFDVSHMAVLRIYGQKRFQLVNRVLTTDPSKKNKSGQMYLSLMLNSQGGIIDDVMVSVFQQFYQFILNADNKERNIQHIQNVRKQLGLADVKCVHETQKSIIAFQGPAAAAAIKDWLSVNTNQIPFMTHFKAKDYNVSRSGYTGQDGFQIIADNKNAVQVFDTLKSKYKAVPAGLGARDCLRLEAGLCLNGHDMTPGVTTPAEASLNWLVRKQGDYLGRKQQKEKEAASKSRRIGFVVAKENGIFRQGAQVIVGSQKVGKVTSGTFSPVLGHGIGMCYAPIGTKVGQKVSLLQKGKQVQATVTKMPFVQHKYFKK